MREKTVLITGANSGIGFVTARELAGMGARVLMICRDDKRGAHARTLVAQAATGAAPELLLADMSSQQSVRVLAGDVRQRFPKIDVLINNAGGIFAERGFTVDGTEPSINHPVRSLPTNE
jgi:NAD(P)-dependent dehydrogenase (short-subunit alcohol dehydrogenase family)